MKSAAVLVGALVLLHVTDATALQGGFREAIPSSAFGNAKQSGVIAGRILAVDGKPVVGVRVAAIAAPPVSDSKGPQSPIRNAEMLSLGQTAADGKYRQENLPAGRYYIVADRLDSPIFYPGVTTQYDAKIITLGGNAILEKQDFQLTAPFSFRVRGRVIREGGHSAGAQVSLSVSNVGPAQLATIAPDGSFEFPSVRPGTYQVRILPRLNSLPAVSLVVTDRDISDLELKIPLSAVVP